ncbi:type II toxin-antitoxin system VapC family toxin [Rhizobium sp. L1K21]|uniref:type II toxin-antitoxin system VapC family toxin n=1 Tax=Rhizobium sp. L1K21 TaxID=2954933 RepID=UPI00209321A7|nr:type II toxin-antitoxin system VapC family toxin [Rhizobium sp. L1K21]MCO6185067.1 type II toxin-antitoxin system VapC family toxin [Rhizobium sp. L1K21]
MATMIDTNILVDIAVRDPEWIEWSRKKIAEAARRGALVINQIIFAEFSVRYSNAAEVEAILPADEFIRESLPWNASFAAGRAFGAYRRAGGARNRVLPDFLIGAHAYLHGYALLTRDPKGYRTYFPDLELITPETHP